MYSNKIHVYDAYNLVGLPTVSMQQNIMGNIIMKHLCLATFKIYFCA